MKEKRRGGGVCAFDTSTSGTKFLSFYTDDRETLLDGMCVYAGIEYYEYRHPHTSERNNTS